MLKLVGLFLLANVALISAADVTRDVNTTYGRIRGKQMETFTGRPYYAFQQVPYAKAPTGHLRFAEPTKPNKWDTVLDTLEANKVCLQLWTEKNDQESEDCLYLNVYTPRDPSKIDNETELLPVYFWIHGGLFVTSHGNFERIPPHNFVDRNIIFVSPNYRLGVLGFLCTDDGVIPCNLGLKDQAFAMQWVQDNIKNFGGDPKKVTIGGQSSGSGSVGHHIISKKSTGLFQAAIMESGSPICSKMFQRDPTYYGWEMGKLIDGSLNETVNSTTELLGVLRGTDIDIVKFFKEQALLEIPVDKRNSVGDVDNNIWAPAMENTTDGFIASAMHEDLKNGNINKVPLLIGFTSEEEMLFMNFTPHAQKNLAEIKESAKLFDTEKESIMINYYLNITDDKRLEAGKKLKEVYINASSSSFTKETGKFIKFISDAKYTTGIVRHAELQSKHTDVYLYQFSYKGLLNIYNLDLIIEGADRVGHTEELNYLFGPNSYSDISDYPSEDVTTSNRMLRMWTNFIIHQNPTPKEDPLLGNVIWPKLTTNETEYLNIKETLESSKGPKLYTKWRAIYDEYADAYQTTY